MQNKNLNLLSVHVFIILSILLSGQACTSKRFAKQAQKLEDAGLYEMAADNYLRSLNANPKNIEAATGLRRTAQRTINSKADLVAQAWLSGDDRETVYKYIDVQTYHKIIRNTGIELSIPRQVRNYYEEAKPRFLERSFNEARLLLEEENFSKAETLFSEIKEIDPLYQDLNQYMKISRSEPLYREGLEQFNSGYYRKAYNTFSILLNNHGAYKDTKELREDAIAKGMLTIAIADFENNSSQRNAPSILKSRITEEIGKLNNPFIQVVDDRNINAFLKEQELAAKLGTDIKIGHLMAARALLSGKLLNFDVQEGRLQRNEKRAYMKEIIAHENKATKEKTTEIIYHKVSYTEYQRENKAYGSFQYQLSSTETGAILASGVIELSPSDRIQYAVFEGKTDNLVPGYWEYKDKNSTKDLIQDEQKMVKNLQNLFTARQTIKSANILRNELTSSIAQTVSQSVNSYNPEK